MSLVVYDNKSIISSLYQTTRIVHVGGCVEKDFKFYQKGSGTGGLIWPASVLLSNFLAQTITTLPQLRDLNWNEQTVLELGAGLGLVSSTLVHLGSRVVATDGISNVVDQLEENLRINTHKDLHDQFMCSVLDWGDMESLNAIEWLGQGQRGVDVVVASDVVYGEQEMVWRRLATTLHKVCRIRNEYIVEHGDGFDNESFERLNPTIVLLAQVITVIVSQYRRMTTSNCNCMADTQISRERGNVFRNYEKRTYAIRGDISH